MTTIATRQCLSGTWLQTPLNMKSVIGGGTDRIFAATKRLEVRWEARARRAVAIHQLSALSDRELLDLGIGRSEIPRVACETNSVR